MCRSPSREAYHDEYSACASYAAVGIHTRYEATVEPERASNRQRRHRSRLPSRPIGQGTELPSYDCLRTARELV